MHHQFLILTRLYVRTTLQISNICTLPASLNALWPSWCAYIELITEWCCNFHGSQHSSSTIILGYSSSSIYNANMLNTINNFKIE